MDFRTAIRIESLTEPIKHSDKLMLIGSCFSTNIGERLRDAMMPVMVNPMGTLYNPMSIARAVERMVRRNLVTGTELFSANGVWNCFDFHSAFSSADQDVALRRMNDSITAAHEHLKECKCVIVTLGTAIVYWHDNKVVANCHKLPAAQFSKRMLSLNETVEALRQIVELLREVNPKMRVIFTVSPIRHIADGLADNSLSKSILRVAIGELGIDDVHYFPSYEIMLDDLRDYRFYAADMVHPSEVAIGYIWEQFRAACICPESLKAIDRCERMTKWLRHRSMSDNTEVVAQLNADRQAAYAKLRADYPYIPELTT
ncbi:MAG: GSCFA domain-containing protein [Muribaculaceae bacterium]